MEDWGRRTGHPGTVVYTATAARIPTVEANA
jgi:hypothetical protein